MPRGNYDEYLSGILMEEKSIIGFLNSIFDFLARRTDFYYIPKELHENIGYPEGLAQELVFKVMNKCNPNYFNANSGVMSEDASDFVPNAIAEVEVGTDYVLGETCGSEKLEPGGSNDLTASVEKMSVSEHQQLENGKSSRRNCESESYNGADRQAYAWSQTIAELEVTVRLPPDIKSSKNVKVVTTSESVQIKYSLDLIKWITLIKDTFPYKVKNSETLWTMSEGPLRIHFEKQQERWWEHLLSNEPRVDLSKIDCSRPLHELPEEHLSKVRELQWNHEQKLKGLPTSEEAKQMKLLKKAWDLEGSPFKGTPFNPDVLRH